ncbi:hypothetical protein PLEOSDRAFT_1090955 [Pleurotus ostreatus PC15]|uniref:Uncharacterized protein n=1 Tax=Pleurotus ostreatus (strain PC15) TaxID=1137138 RepID=A0A067N317_PLEO1|nr:hypothetical protein PLEOSDRAFT_1090955 [Pleurotus ostreatus PC15]
MLTLQVTLPTCGELSYAEDLSIPVASRWSQFTFMPGKVGGDSSGDPKPAIQF